MKFKNRPYQTDIINIATDAKGSVLIESPTGSGKTYMAKQIIQNEIKNNGKALIVAPKINLLDQMADTFIDLAPQIIHGQKDYNPEHNVFVSTLQTAYQRELGFTPSMILIDETHYGFTGKMINKLLDGFDGKVVGLSATPYDKKGNPLEGFGTHINKYNVDYMIKHEYLTPVISYKPVKVNLKGIRKTAGDYNLGDLDERFNKPDAVFQVVNATKDLISDRKHTLVFCITIAHAKVMRDAFIDAGITSATIHSKMTIEERDMAMAGFKDGTYKVLTNVDVLTTGFDFPATDTIVLARPTQSQNLYKQIVGRGMRPAEGKSHMVLLDCAGVISNLGLPTKPIVARANQKDDDERGDVKCKNCGSTSTRIVHEEEVRMRECLACGFMETLEDPHEGYTCSSCHAVYGAEAKLIAIDSKVYLDCDCGHRTIISEETEETELEELIDPTTAEMMAKRAIKTYTDVMLDMNGIPGIITDIFSLTVRAIERSMHKAPASIIDLTREYMVGEISKYGYLLSEDELLDYLGSTENTKEILEDDLEGASTFNSAIKAYNELAVMTGNKIMSKEIVTKVKADIKTSKRSNMSQLCASRIKNIYRDKISPERMKGFVPYIESH